MEQPTTLEQALARIAMLEQQNAIKASGSIKVSKTGGVSVYGLGRFPVTLYKSQWESLIAKIPDVQAFINANADKLTVKESATPAVQEA